MTNEEKDLLIAYLVDAGEIDPDGDVEAEVLDWYQVREGVVSGETHYKALLEAARVRKRSFDRGTKLADIVRSAAEDIPSEARGFCDHDTPCGCYAEGYAAGRMDGAPREDAGGLLQAAPAPGPRVPGGGRGGRYQAPWTLAWPIPGKGVAHGDTFLR